MSQAGQEARFRLHLCDASGRELCVRALEQLAATGGQGALSVLVRSEGSGQPATLHLAPTGPGAIDVRLFATAAGRYHASVESDSVPLKGSPLTLEAPRPAATACSTASWPRNPVH